MVYAIFGIPLTLFAVTNLGSIMATAFRLIYKFICCGLCCLCCSNSRRKTRPPSRSVTQTSLVSNRSAQFVSSRTGRGRRHPMTGRSQRAAADGGTESTRGGSRQHGPRQSGRKYRKTGVEATQQQMALLEYSSDGVDTVSSQEDNRVQRSTRRGRFAQLHSQLTTIINKQNSIDKVYNVFAIEK